MEALEMAGATGVSGAITVFSREKCKNVEGCGWEMVRTPRTFGDLEFLLALVVILFLGASVPSFEQTDVCVQQSHNSTS